jgi:hypothetical protein
MRLLGCTQCGWVGSAPADEHEGAGAASCPGCGAVRCETYEVHHARDLVTLAASLGAASSIMSIGYYRSSCDCDNYPTREDHGVSSTEELEAALIRNYTGAKPYGWSAPYPYMAHTTYLAGVAQSAYTKAREAIAIRATLWECDEHIRTLQARKQALVALLDVGDALTPTAREAYCEEIARIRADLRVVGARKGACASQLARMGVRECDDDGWRDPTMQEIGEPPCQNAMGIT